MMIIDTHSHIHFQESFPDYEEVIERAIAASVKKQILVGCNLEDSLNALRFSQKYEGIYPTIGIHPHDSDQWNEKSESIFRRILKGEFVAIGQEELNGTQDEESKAISHKLHELEKKPVAIGEIGLDYFRNLQPVEMQKRVLKAQLALANEFDLPVIIHVRDAFEDSFQVLEEAGNEKVLLHCFSGGIEEAQKAWERGYMISFSGVVTYPKNEELRKVAAMAPLDKFVVETDCPFLAPQKYRGQRNEPAFVVETLRQIAEIRSISLEEAAQQTTENVLRFFQITETI